MQLKPRRPPGHPSRKALGFASDIAQMHRDGYGVSAIRLALADAGLEVSISTVKREILRTSVLPPRAPSWPVTPQALPGPAPPTAAAPVGTAPVSDAATPSGQFRGKAVAADFMSGRSSNPLLRRSPQ